MISGGRTRTSSTASSRMTWIRRGSASSPASSRACSDGSTSASATTWPSTFEIGLLRDDDHVPVRQLCPLGDECREVVSLPQLRQSLDRRDRETWPDVLDEDQRRVVVTPEAVQLLERDEADRLVERAGRVVATVRARGAERLHLEVADAARPAPRSAALDERAPDAAAMVLAPNGHDVDLGRSRRVLLKAEEAEIRLYRERRKRRGVLDVWRVASSIPNHSGRSRSTASARRDRSAGSEISTTCVTGDR